MKKLLPILLLTSLLLSACSIWGKEDLFEKKQECMEYKNKMTEYLDKNWYSSTTIKEIFYSDKWNSCYFISETLVGETKREFLFDYLSNKLIATKINCSEIWKSYCTVEMENEDKKYLKQIQFLKWE